MARPWVPLLAAAMLLSLGTVAAAQEDRALVAAEVVEAADIFEQVSLNGTVTAARVSRVSTEIGGKVTTMQVDAGQAVAAGEVLATLENSFALLALRRAEAETLEAETALKDATRRLAMTKALTARQAISENELHLREAEVTAGRAGLEGMRAAQEEQAVRLEKHRILAPFSGVVARRMTEAGAWVEPGDDILELVDMDRPRIDVPVPQGYFFRMTDDTRVTVDLGALPGQTLEGGPRTVIPVLDPTSRVFTVRVDLLHHRDVVKPGMSARVTFHLAAGTRGLVVSRDAILRHPDGRVAVWVLEDGGAGPTVTERLVRLGPFFDDKVQIREGVKEGERVIVEGNEALQPNQAVRLEGRAAEVSFPTLSRQDPARN